MRKPDTRIKFMSNHAKREAKVAHLKAEGTPEARAALKKMNTIHMHAGSSSVKGYWRGSHPLKAKVNAKTRHHLSAAKAIMSGR